MDGELVLKIRQREKGAVRVETFLVLPVAAFDLSVVPWSVRADELVADAKISGSFLKKGLDIPLAVRKTFGKLKTVVDLDTFHADALAGIPLYQAFQEISGRISGLLQDKLPGSGAWRTHLLHCTGTGATLGR